MEEINILKTLKPRNCKFCNKEIFVNRCCNPCKMIKTNAMLKEKNYFNDYYKNNKETFAKKHIRNVEKKKADANYIEKKVGRPKKIKNDELINDINIE
jgi:hypothetical protein